MRKKLLIGLTVMLVLLACIVAPACAESGQCGDDATWEWNGSSHTLTISGSGDMYDYSADSPAPWYDLVKDGNLFYLSISDDITSIGDYAFKIGTDTWFGGMNTSLPSNLTKIGHHAFEYVYGVNSLEIPASVETIYNDSFLNMRTISSITVASGNQYFCAEDGVLYDINKTELLFYPLYKMTGDYTLPDTVTTIGHKAFANNYITTLRIGSNLQNYENDSFDGMINLTEFIVDNGNQNLVSEDGVLFNGDKTVLLKYPASKSDASYVVPDGVIVLKEGSFSENSNANFTTITLSPDMENFEGAFTNEMSVHRTLIAPNGCLHFVNDSDLNLYSDDMTVFYNAHRDGGSGYDLIIPEGVTTIAKEACYGQSLDSIVFPSTLETIGERAFVSSSIYGELVIPDNVTTIGDDNFTTVCISSGVIGNGVTHIPKNFMNNSLFECTVTLGDNVQTIDPTAFYNYQITLEISPNNQYLTIEDGVIYNKEKTALIRCNSNCTKFLTLPNTVTEIKTGAFNSGYPNVLTLSTGMTEITKGMFRESNINEVILPDTITKIDEEGFAGSFIMTLVIPESVTSIGKNALVDMVSLHYLTLNSHVSDVKDIGLLSDTNIKVLTLSENNPYYSVKNNVLYNKDETELIFCPSINVSDMMTYVIPSGVKTIKSDSFYIAAMSLELLFPDTLEIIENDAFVIDTSASNVNYLFADNSHLSYVGEKAFKHTYWGMSNYPDVTLPTNVVKDGCKFEGWYDSDDNLVTSTTNLENKSYHAKLTPLIAEVYDENENLVKDDCTSLSDINTALGSNEGYTVKFLTDATFTESDLTEGQWNCNNNTTFTTDNDVTITLKVSDGGVYPSNIRVDVGTKGATFENLKIKIESPSDGFSSINIRSGCVFDNCEIESNKNIFVNGDNGSNVLNVEFNDCKIKVTDDDAVKLRSLNYGTTEDVVELNDCEITATKEGKYAILSMESSGKETGVDSNVSIENCTVKGVSGSIGCTSVVNPFTGIISSGKFSDDIALQGYVASGYSTELNGEWYNVISSGEYVAEVWDDNGVVASFSNLQNALNSVDSSSKYIKIIADFDCAGDIDFDKNFNLKITSDTQNTINVTNNWTVSGTVTFENLNLNFAGDGVYITDDDSDYASNVKFDNCSITVTDGEFAIYDDSYHKKLIIENTKVKSSDLGVVVDNSGSDEDFSNGIGKNVNITGNSQIQTDGIALSVSGYVNVNAESSKFIATHDSSITLNGLNSGSEISIVGCTVGASNMDSSLYAISYSSNECDTVLNIQNSILYAGGANVIYVGGDGDLTLENVEISSGNVNAIVIENMGEDGSVILNNCKIASYGNCVKESWNVPNVTGEPIIILDECKMYSDATLNLQHGNGIVTNGLYRTIDDVYLADGYHKVWEEEESAYRITNETYTVTIGVNNSEYGSVSATTVENVAYGTILSNDGNVLHVGDVSITATPNKSSAQYDYQFVNWANGTATVSGDTEVIANFSRYVKNYSVTFHANDGSGLTSEQEFVYGTEQNLNENTFVRTGYSFGGWALTSNGNPVYTDKQKIAITEDIDLYAYWIYGGGQGTKIPTEVGVPIEIEDTYGNVTSVIFTDSPSDNMILVFKDETEESVPELQGNVIRLPYDISLYKNGELYHELGADIEFIVLKSSVESTDNVKLAHYVNGTWTYIDVVLIGEDDDSYKFRAHVDSFSPFSIIEEKSVTPVSNHDSSSLTAFTGEKNGNVFTFDDAVVIKKAVLPNATYARVVNGSGSDWYVCNLNTDLNGVGAIYFQIPLDVISIKKGTVNNVSVYAGSVECPIKYLASEGGYAKYVANITGGGKIYINVDPNYTSSNVATEIGERVNEVKDTVTEFKETVNEVKETVVETKPVTASPTSKTTKNPTTPVPIMGMIGGFGIAGWLLLRRRH